MTLTKLEVTANISATPQVPENVKCRSIKYISKLRDFTTGEQQKRLAQSNTQPSSCKISREFACYLAVALKETNVFTSYQSPCNSHSTMETFLDIQPTRKCHSKQSGKAVPETSVKRKCSHT